jgi:predicted nucleic acid-binding protein
MYLFDTNVISAVAPSKTERAEVLADWLDRASDRLFLSAITASEVHAGIAKAVRLGATSKAGALLEWWQAIEHLYADRILAFDLHAARVAGGILDAARAHDPGFEDIAIAATARVHGLTVLTTNELHFQPLGVPWINPLAALPDL